MGQRASARGHKAPSTVITNALSRPAGDVKPEYPHGGFDCRDRQGSNPDVQPGVDIVIGPGIGA